ncbi:MAG: glycosyltransferase family 39 protein [Pseudobutyrivibrio ruminis]|uniref:Glycosyltransferase family 39 protein n=1 Tax=Pseudobutyrivibrio ruminis TaxID=46206 RepID=A0A927U9R0_9FIRM|nr:glycosyltransferase family 39 protein [Pseudobutyrivibrio ruminis]
MRIIKKFPRIIAAVYAIVLFYVNFIRIFDEALWLDEAFTGNIIRLNIPGLLEATAKDVHPPLYYIITKAFCAIVGEKGWSLHFVSIVPLAVILVFSLTVIWNKFGAEAALIVMTFTSISDAALRFNVEIRMYSWAAMLVFFSYYYFYNILVENRVRDWVLFSVFSLAAAYTHYYALIAVAFFYAFLFFRNIVQRKDIKRILTTIVVAVVVYLPWLIVLVKSLTARINNYWITENSTFADCFNFLVSYKFTIGIWLIIAVMFVLAIAYEIGILHWEKDKEVSSQYIAGYHLFVSKKAESSELVLFIIAGIISVVGTMAVGIGISALLSPFFVTRYIYVVGPVAWLVLGIVFSKMKLSIAWTTILLVYSIYSFIPSYKAVYYEDLDISNRTNMVRSIVANMGENDVIITDFEDPTMPDYYFAGKTYERVLDLNNLVIPDDGKNYWLIVGDTWSYDDIASKLAEQGVECENILDYGLLGHTKILGYKCVK